MHPDSSDTCGKVMASRQTAEGAIRERARRMHEQACALEKLADQAAHMRGDAEEALWNLVCQSR